MVCWLFVGSALFSAVFALLGGQEVIERWVLSLGQSKFTFIAAGPGDHLPPRLAAGVGRRSSSSSMPILPAPPGALRDSTRLFFGLLVALNLQTAFLSPPVAMAAFYLKGLAPPYVP
jgi:TRAP-type mannitol/chloroaromatic compound transport system permease large subunit